MCGIAGMVQTGGEPPGPALIERMLEQVAFRGPDDQGIYAGGPAVLGHRRLSVIDLETGRQPMGNEDGTVQVVSNSEIYNYRELRSGLQARGHRFRTKSDTEVILHLYEEKGADCVQELRGMFAFALWDEREQRLLLARDRLGQKPLYYAEAGSTLLFASLPAPLLLHPEVSPEVDPEAVDLFLSLLYIPGPRTLYRRVRKLAPAHCLEWRRGRIRLSRYWRLRYGPKRDLSEDEAAEGVGERLEEAVRLRLASDVPLGAFLSGGIDSSLVVALMTRHLDAPVRTYSVGYLSPRFDEVPHARYMSRHLGTEHSVTWFRRRDLDALPEMIDRCPEPMADPSLLPMFLLSRRARRELTVVLSGDAGDENFAGYDRYQYAWLARLLRGVPDGLRDRFWRGLGRAVGEPGAPAAYRNRWSKFLRFLRATPEAGHLHQFDQLGGIDREALYRPETRRLIASPGPAADYFASLFSALPAEADWLDRLLAVDVVSYLAWDILPKVDTASMAHALELRSPFLDHPLMEFVARLPSSHKLRGLSRKYVLKRYGSRWLPRSVVHRRKVGFGLPIAAWLRGPRGEEALEQALDPNAETRWLFRPSGLRALWDEHRSGGRDRSYVLWAVLVLEQWLRCQKRGVPARSVDSPRPVG